jgi:hypothetical protein
LHRKLPAAQTLDIDVDGTVDPLALRALPGIKTVTFEAGRLTVGLDDLALGAHAVLEAVAAAGASVRRLNSGRANLEDVFLALTGRQLRD